MVGVRLGANGDGLGVSEATLSHVLVSSGQNEVRKDVLLFVPS